MNVKEIHNGGFDQGYGTAVDHMERLVTDFPHLTPAELVQHLRDIQVAIEGQLKEPEA